MPKPIKSKKGKSRKNQKKFKKLRLIRSPPRHQKNRHAHRTFFARQNKQKEANELIYSRPKAITLSRC